MKKPQVLALVLHQLCVLLHAPDLRTEEVEAGGLPRVRGQHLLAKDEGSAPGHNSHSGQ